MHKAKLADLDCRIVGEMDGSKPPEAVVVLCHGFGAAGDDLVPLAGELIRLKPQLADSVLFVFPEGSLRIPEVPSGRAWWPIDLVALQMAAEAGRFREMRQNCPPLLPEARRKLMQLIEVLREKTGLPLSRFVLGGFSQGSMLATDVVLRLEETAGGLLIYSGTLLVEPEWTELASGRRGMRVLQSHGMVDPLLPFEAAGWLRDLLSAGGAEVRFLPFQGVHTISAEALVATAELLEEVIQGQTG
jgi:phospholipase/carboxylesterase